MPKKNCKVLPLSEKIKVFFQSGKKNMYCEVAQITIGINLSTKL